MKYLTVEDVLYLHVLAMLSTGDEPRDPRETGLLDSAVAQPAVTFGGEDLYPTLPVKGAAIFRSLIKNHPFIDGNKRTAFLVLSAFLRLNGHHLTFTQDEAFEFVLWVATSSSSVEEIADSLARKIAPAP